VVDLRDSKSATGRYCARLYNRVIGSSTVTVGVVPAAFRVQGLWFDV
jgi:hypothetical protein